MHLPFIERLIRAHNHDGGRRKTQIQQIKTFRIRVGGGEPLRADGHGRLMADDHEHMGLVLDVGEFVEHGLHSPVIQADAIIDDRLVTERLEHAIQRLPGAGGGRAGNPVGHQSQRFDTLAHGFGLFEAFLGELTLDIALVSERLSLGMPHDDEDMVIFLGCLGDLVQLDAHPWLPSRTAARPCIASSIGPPKQPATHHSALIRRCRPSWPT